MDHLPHDERHTCATMLDNADISKVIIKKILGHAGKDVTEKVYTQDNSTTCRCNKFNIICILRVYYASILTSFL